MTRPEYRIEQTADIITPALLVFPELVNENISRMLRIAGSPEKLRPHCKTHKMAAVTQLLLRRGIAKHKCATFAEAEMLADAGVRDILLAYNIVGANIARTVKFVQKYPAVTFAVTADHPLPLRQLSEAMHSAGASVEVLLDIDTGQHRTGIVPGDEAAALYHRMADLPGIEPAGFHIYDGHQHQHSREERKAAVLAEFQKVRALREKLESAGLSVPQLVCGGTASFPVYAELDDPAIFCSPGTCVFHDVGYGERFPDLEFIPVALLLTRVISRPTQDRLTLDLGYKAVASDPPAGKRAFFPALPTAEAVLQNEEHLVLQTPQAGDFQPGDELLAIPRHICPTTALHKEVYVVSDGKVTERWPVTARDRWLTL